MIDKIVLFISNFGFAILTIVSIIYAITIGSLFEMIIILLIVMSNFDIRKEIVDKKELDNVKQKYNNLEKIIKDKINGS